MVKKNRIFLAAALVVAASLPGCNSSLDSGSSADVILEAENINIPPVTASLNTTTLTCDVTLTLASATFKNKPKNASATTSPYNDIILHSVLVNYAWDDGFVTPQQVFGVPGTVPANGSTTASFGVVTFAELSNPPPNGRFGHTAAMSLNFQGTTVSGNDVSLTTGATLTVGTCTISTGACCSPPPGGVCTQTDPNTCTTSGGTYIGDNTTCATTVCP